MKYEGNKIVYEVGDWIIGHSNKTGQIIEKIICNGNTSGLKYSVNGETYTSYERSSRPASQEEIDEALGEEKIIIGGYEVLFNTFGAGRTSSEIKVGCQEVSKETFLKIGKKAGWR